MIPVNHASFFLPESRLAPRAAKRTFFFDSLARFKFGIEAVVCRMKESKTKNVIGRSRCFCVAYCTRVSTMSRPYVGLPPPVPLTVVE